jgi:alpha-glucosidase
MDVRHDYDGNPCSHRKHIIFMVRQMARATYHGVKDLLIRKDLLLSRDLLMQGQRYSSSWTGDNVATWEHLWIANIQVKECQFLEWVYWL